MGEIVLSGATGLVGRRLVEAFSSQGMGVRALTRSPESTSFRAPARALAWDGRSFLPQPALPVQIIDPIGAGDALAAGILYGWLGGDLEQGLRIGAVLAALALTQKGDMITTTTAEVNSLLEDGPGRIRR